MTLAEIQRPSVLLVEPQFVLRRTVAALARKLDLAEVSEATSVEAAVAAMKRQAFDKIVLDFADPPAALDLIRRLRRGELATKRDALVCFTSAEALPGSVRDEAKAEGVTAHLSKPYKLQHLLLALNLAHSIS